VEDTAIPSAAGGAGCQRPVQSLRLRKSTQVALVAKGPASPCGSLLITKCQAGNSSGGRPSPRLYAGASVHPLGSIAGQPQAPALGPPGGVLHMGPTKATSFFCREHVRRHGSGQDYGLVGIGLLACDVFRKAKRGLSRHAA
jgi:hypothetical protein